MADEVEDLDAPPLALSFAASKELTIELSKKTTKEVRRFLFNDFVQGGKCACHMIYRVTTQIIARSAK